VLSGLDPETSTSSATVFCSYRRTDDADLFNGVVRSLVRDLKTLYKADTGYQLEIFLDRDELQWGDDFESAISRAVQDAVFFMPIITANYFESERCRREFYGFYGKAQSLGVVELVLPVLLAGSHLVSVNASDPIARIVAATQYVDWSDLWQHGPDSAQWRTAITGMVRRIRQLQRSVESQLTEQLLKEQGGNALSGRADEGSSDPAPNPMEWELNEISVELAAVFTLIDQLARDAVELLTAVDVSLRSISPLPGQGRLDRARFSAEFAPRAVGLERRAADIIGRALDIDVRVRKLYSDDVRNGGRTLAIKHLCEELRGGARRAMSSLANVVPVSSVVNRLRGPGLTGTSAAVGQIIQTLRDLSLLVDRWENQR
jgi:hypothetical protein